MGNTFTEPQPTPLALLLLGHGSDPRQRAGRRLPRRPARRRPTRTWSSAPAPPRPPSATASSSSATTTSATRSSQFADVTGDSFKLAQQAAAHPEAEFIVFCGVHFMAESADILTADRPAGDPARPRRRLLDGRHGRDRARSRTCWAALEEAGVADVTVPITYMNSTAAIKAFTGRHGGAVCTSSNAERSLQWAFEQGEKVLFLPDQHLGRNTAVRDLGLSLDDCVVYNPHQPERRADRRAAARRQHDPVEGALLGARPVHARTASTRSASGCPASTSSCIRSASTRSSRRPMLVGSTEKIIATITAAEPGTAWAVGTELNLVKRLALANPDKEIVYLDRTVCFCSTMNRIDLPHLVWALESLVAGTVVNRIEVDPDTAHWARVALDRMLALPGPTPARD